MDDKYIIHPDEGTKKLFYSEFIKVLLTDIREDRESKLKACDEYLPAGQNYFFDKSEDHGVIF